MHQEPAIPDVDDAPRLLLPGIMGGVAIFGVIVAAGVYGRTGKLLALPVVLGTVGAFLLTWFLAVRNRLRMEGGIDSQPLSPTAQSAVTKIGVVLLAVGWAGLVGGVIQALRRGVTWEPLAYSIFAPTFLAGIALLLWGQRHTLKLKAAAAPGDRALPKLPGE